MTEAAAADTSPHGMLRDAYATLKKEKDAIVALTDLQRKEKQDLAEELELTKKSLCEEQLKVDELTAKLELKAVSAQCQIEEVESFSQDTLAGALEKNAKLSEKVVDLEFAVTEEKREKEYLLQRTATLARRDQLQKASIKTLSEEINALTEQIKQFEDQFSSLASRTSEMTHSEVKKREAAAAELHEKIKAEWLEEKKTMADRISALETSNNKMKVAQKIMKDKFVETLTKHKESWRKEQEEMKGKIEEAATMKDQEDLEKEKEEWLKEKKIMADRITILENSFDKMKDTERIMNDKFAEKLSKQKEKSNNEKLDLKKQIEELIFEKEGIEAQVTEIAELLERDQFERFGKVLSIDSADMREPPGAKQVMVYNH